jgi:alpha-1,3-glucan synthase
MVFPDHDYDTSGGFTLSNGQYQYAHKAYGADMFRYSGNFGRTWSDWKKWEDTTSMEKALFDNNFWPGEHLMVQCEPIPLKTNPKFYSCL